MYLYNKRHIFKGYSLFLAIFYNGFHYLKERVRYFLIFFFACYTKFDWLC